MFYNPVSCVIARQPFAGRSRARGASVGTLFICLIIQMSNLGISAVLALLLIRRRRRHLNLVSGIPEKFYSASIMMSFCKS